MEKILPLTLAALGPMAADAVLALALPRPRKGAPTTSLGLVAPSHAASFEARDRAGGRT